MLLLAHTIHAQDPGIRDPDFYGNFEPINGVGIIQSEKQAYKESRRGPLTEIKSLEFPGCLAKGNYTSDSPISLGHLFPCGIDDESNQSA
jgi:hypothetical protein